MKSAAAYRSRSRGAASGSRRTKHAAQIGRPVHFGRWSDRVCMRVGSLVGDVHHSGCRCGNSAPNHAARAGNIGAIFPKTSLDSAQQHVSRLRSLTAKMREKFTTMTVGELREFAKEKGLRGYSRLRKDELIDTLMGPQ